MPRNFGNIERVKVAQLIMYLATAMLGIEMWMLMEDLWPHLGLPEKSVIFLATLFIVVSFGYVQYAHGRRRRRK